MLNRRYLTTEELDGLRSGKGQGDAQDASAADLLVGPGARPSPQRQPGYDDPDAMLEKLRQKTPKNENVLGLSEGAILYLENNLPRLQQTLSEAEVEERIQSLAQGAPYHIGKPLARGAESVLYEGDSNDYLFCVKSVRNTLDRWLGNRVTRGNAGKLAAISYRTKYRHISNEFAMGRLLASQRERSPLPVRIFSLRKVSWLCVELGYDLLMERINGMDLSDKGLLRNLSLSDKVKICIAATQSVALLHQLHMVHLDIKPSNFMLERNGRIRLIDFGISVPSGYYGKAVAGTAGFFSPEQICRNDLREDTDIFALGVTFAILFGGRPLAQTAEEARSKSYRTNVQNTLVKSAVPAISEIPELTSHKALADVIRACTIYRRDKRWNSCQSLIVQLRNAAAQCGVQL